MKSIVIAIDGPAASGKGTLARRLAGAFNLPYLDTGLLYRAVARRVLDHGADPADAEAATEQARTLNRVDLERDDLRTKEVDLAASAVASIAPVRAALLDFQRDFAQVSGAVLDGRDIGTIVFPKADVKLFITASLDVRAERRFAERKAQGVATTLEAVRADLAARDEADRTRAAAPLRPARDAHRLDTSTLDADHAFAAAAALVNQALSKG
ncbi:(d)CMP kinase [Acidiphilium sp. AL]|uniref:Cytidylate kinase n=1 Tax=Acidiphilium iwatense TaxID=768198 RepID=A0ABS9DVD8_9PROT|nr:MULTISPECIES: (d)CMP kinase [Acidiphilium]MCF3946098.1 (d)CMP kinase [Acidiphilium iwatense]MCU4160968.1 (d)CMP kinase [Acidiphilium sp. AL]